MIVSRRNLMLGALAGTVALSATACGSNGGSSSGGGERTGNTLTVWAWDPQFNIYALKEAEKIFKQKNPDFSLNISEIAWDDVQTKLTTMAQSGQLDGLPDIFLMQNNAFQKNVTNYPELFADFEDSKVDFGQFPKAVEDYSTINGKHFGLPFDSGTAINALRVDYLEAAGFKIEDFTNITWDDYIAKGKVVKEKTGHPMIATNAANSDLIMMMMQSAGASLFDKDGKPTIAGNETLIKAIETYVKAMKEGVLVQVNAWDEYVGGFVSGNIAGVMNGVWIVGSIQTAKDQEGKWRITNVPSLNGVSGATNYTTNGGSSWAVSSKANKSLAQDFLRETFAGSTEFYDTILPTSGAIANWEPAGKSKVYEEPQPFFGGQPIYSEVVEYGTKVPTANTGVYFYEGRDAVSAAITKVVNGAPIAQALDEAQKNVEFAMK
ncbi:ABC transporter substrate-binding protein [Dermabacteraceae bacterium P13115]